jgi:hypothetical protein
MQRFNSDKTATALHKLEELAGHAPVLPLSTVPGLHRHMLYWRFLVVGHDRQL